MDDPQSRVEDLHLFEGELLLTYEEGHIVLLVSHFVHRASSEVIAGSLSHVHHTVERQPKQHHLDTGDDVADREDAEHKFCGCALGARDLSGARESHFGVDFSGE